MFRMIATVRAACATSACRCNADFTLDLERLLAAIEEHRPALIFIAYPNNPTGNLFPTRRSWSAILEAAPGIVVLDEAYHAFAGKTFMSRLPSYPNLLVMRTVSKLGLAGLRLGYAVGAAAEWLQRARQGTATV